jgi:hypothetical protein
MNLWAVAALASVLADPAPRIERLGRWLEAVERHQPGVADAAVSETAALSIAEVQMLGVDAQSVVVLIRNPSASILWVAKDGRRTGQLRYTPPEAEALRQLAKRRSRPEIINALKMIEVNTLLKRAALLESDVAMLTPMEGGPIVQAPQGAAQRLRMDISDGRQRSLQQMPVHWELARKMLDLVLPDPTKDDTVIAWYHATMAHMQWTQEHDIDHFARARELFPSDPVVLFFNGCMHEDFAAELIQQAMRTAKLPSGVSFLVGSDTAELRTAETFLRRAVAADATHVEARLRLARVIGQLGRHQDAASELRTVTGSTEDSLLLYYAHLFLGREEEALGHGEEARTAYARAAALYPAAQSPRLALSQLAWHAHNREAALQALEPPVDAVGDDDPWFSYRFMQGRTVDERLAALRQPFLKDPQ